MYIHFQSPGTAPGLWISPSPHLESNNNKQPQNRKDTFGLFRHQIANPKFSNMDLIWNYYDAKEIA
jgi:hypothetical protein